MPECIPVARIRRRALAVATVAWALLAPALAIGNPVAHRLELAPTGEGAGDQFGIIVGGPGDLNGDGFADIVVDGFLNDAVGYDSGRAYVYFGGPLLSLTPSLVLTGVSPGDNFGVAKGCGDVNDDGYPDLLVGANQAGTYPYTTGKAYLYLGGPAMDNVADMVFTGEAAGDLFGSRVAAAGDFNADGFDDLVIGAIGNAAHGTRTGRAYVYYGGPLLDNVPDKIFTGELAGDEFGLVGRAGDLNDDGYDDLIIGAWLADGGGPDAGRAYVYFGGPGPDNVADRVFTGEAPGDRFGVSVMGTGDVNGDQVADVIVGAYWNDAGGANAGRAYVFYGGPAMDTVADVTLTGEMPGDGFGKSVCDAGDVDGDGYADVIVGAYTSDAGGLNSGRGYVFDGGAPMDAIPDMVFDGEAPGDQLGYWVSSTGDVNGDTFPDVIMGASFNDAHWTDAGRAYLIDFNRYFVTSPNGGEIWPAQGTGTVSWLGAEPADVWLSLDGGANFEREATGVGGSETNSVLIDVPDQPTLSAMIKLTPTNLSLRGQDENDAPFQISDPTGVDPPRAEAQGLQPPWPNPAFASTRLTLELPQDADASIDVYDLSGRRVDTPLAAGKLAAGRSTQIWRPRSLPSGVYVIRARIGGHEQVRRLVWLGSD